MNGREWARRSRSGRVRFRFRSCVWHFVKMTSQRQANGGQTSSWVGRSRRQVRPDRQDLKAQGGGGGSDCSVSPVGQGVLKVDQHRSLARKVGDYSQPIFKQYN